MTRVEQIRQSIVTARRMTLGLVEGLPEHGWLHAPFPGANTVAWTLVHLLIADDWGPVSLGESRRLEGWDEVLASRSFPAPPAILEGLAEAHDRFVERVAELAEADLDRPTRGALAEYAPDLATLLHSHVWHEGFHGGQISVVRKSLGLAPRFG